MNFELCYKIWLGYILLTTSDIICIHKISSFEKDATDDKKTSGFSISKCFFPMIFSSWIPACNTFSSQLPSLKHSQLCNVRKSRSDNVYENDIIVIHEEPCSLVRTKGFPLRLWTFFFLQSHNMKISQKQNNQRSDFLITVADAHKLGPLIKRCN